MSGSNEDEEPEENQGKKNAKGKSTHNQLSSKHWQRKKH